MTAGPRGWSQLLPCGPEPPTDASQPDDWVGLRACQAALRAHGSPGGRPERPSGRVHGPLRQARPGKAPPPGQPGQPGGLQPPTRSRWRRSTGWVSWAATDGPLCHPPSLSDFSTFSAVVATPHPQWGETVAPVLVLREGMTMRLEQLREHVGPLLASHKHPRRLAVVTTLPRNATGKLLKQ